MTELIGGIDYSKQRINDDALQSLQMEHMRGRDLDSFFNSRHSADRVDTEIYWGEEGITVSVPDVGLRKHQVAIYSRRVWHYPYFAIETKLPTLDLNSSVWLGVEDGSGPLAGIACLHQGTIADRWLFVVHGMIHAAHSDVTVHMPANYDTARNEYVIKINRMSAELFIQAKLRAIILFNVTEDIPIHNNTFPYCLHALRASPPTSMSALIELWRHAPGELFLELPRYRNWIGCSDGDPCPERQYALYVENTSTKWNGLVTSTVVTSHPIPVWGYVRKTLLFQSNAAGTLAVQVWAGGAWREWARITLVANQLEVYNLNGEVPIMRAVYTPVGTDTIVVAECMVAGD